jgi:hypothetical protein
MSSPRRGPWRRSSCRQRRERQNEIGDDELGLRVVNAAARDESAGLQLASTTTGTIGQQQRRRRETCRRSSEQGLKTTFRTRRTWEDRGEDCELTQGNYVGRDGSKMTQGSAAARKTNGEKSQPRVTDDGEMTEQRPSCGGSVSFSARSVGCGSNDG